LAVVTENHRPKRDEMERGRGKRREKDEQKEKERESDGRRCLGWVATGDGGRWRRVVVAGGC